MGGIESALRFVGLKADRVRLDTDRRLDALAWNGPIGPEDVSLLLGIAGVFHTVEQTLSPDLEENLVLLEMPRLLLPCLRAAITSLLSSAGFPSIVFPLVNVQELAKQAQLTVRTLQEKP